MDDSTPMRELESFTHLGGEVHNDFRFQRLPGPNSTCQVALFVKGHDKVRALLAVADLQHLDHVLMPQPLQMPGLFQEAVHDLVVRQQFGSDHFYRDLGA